MQGWEKANKQIEKLNNRLDKEIDDAKQSALEAVVPDEPRIRVYRRDHTIKGG